MASKISFWEMRESITGIGAHAHTHVQGTFTLHTQRQIDWRNSTKIKPKSVVTDSLIPSKIPHDCPTPHISPSCCTKAPPLSSFQTWPEAGPKGTYATEHARLSEYTARSTWKCSFTTAPDETPGVVINSSSFPGKPPFPTLHDSLASRLIRTGNGEER